MDSDLVSSVHNYGDRLTVEARVGDKHSAQIDYRHGMVTEVDDPKIAKVEPSSSFRLDDVDWALQINSIPIAQQSAADVGLPGPTPNYIITDMDRDHRTETYSLMFRIYLKVEDGDTTYVAFSGGGTIVRPAFA